MADNKTKDTPTNEGVTTIDIKSMNIYEKLSAISIEITNVNKNLSVGVGNSSYKAVGEADVLAAVRPLEAKYRIYSYPIHRTILLTDTLETVNFKGEVKKQLFERMEVTYRFVNMDKPEEVVDIISYGDGIDSGDKSVGKAMTYADKYALLKAYKIITGEDPDQKESEPLKSNTPVAPRKTTTPAVKKGVSEAVKKECEALGVTLERIAAKKNIKVEDLTDEIVKPGLMILKKQQEQKKQAQVNQPTQTENETVKE